MMRNKLLVGTTNPGKLDSIKRTLSEFEVIGIELEVDEIQSWSINEIIKKKAIDAYFQAGGKPVLVDDTGLYVDSMSGFPGPFIKYLVKQTLSEKEQFFSKCNSKIATLITSVCFFDGTTVYPFEGIAKGKISGNAKGDKGFGFDPFFIPNGETRTFGEMDWDEKQKFSPRKIALEKLKSFLVSNRLPENYKHYER